MLILLVNLILCSVNCYTLMSSLLKMNELKSTSAINKVLFRKLIELYAPKIVPLFLVCNITYINVFGSRIVHLLDYYHQVYNQRKVKIKISVVIFIYNVVIGFCSMSHSLYPSKILNSIWYTYLYFILSLQDFMVWTVVAYYKYGTYQLLGQIYQNLINSKNDEIDAEDIIVRIQTLAKHNRKLNQLVSLLIIIFFILTGTFIVIMITIFLLDVASVYSIDYIPYTIFITVCFVCSVHITVKTDQLYNTISDILLTKYYLKAAQNSKTDLIESSKLYAKIFFRLSLYRKDFQLRIFDYIPLNYNFLLNFFLFIMSYILVIIQTN